jgi:ATP-binding cassette, subfamily F, member 3
LLLRLTCDEFYLVADGEVKPFTDDLEDYVTWLTNYKRDQNKAKKTAIATNKEDAKLVAKQLSQLEKDIDKLTVELKKITTFLEDPALYTPGSDPKKVTEHQIKQKSLIQKLEVAEEEWVRLQGG